MNVGKDYSYCKVRRIQAPRIPICEFLYLGLVLGGFRDGLNENFVSAIICMKYNTLGTITQGGRKLHSTGHSRDADATFLSVMTWMPINAPCTMTFTMRSGFNEPIAPFHQFIPVSGDTYCSLARNSLSAPGGTHFAPSDLTTSPSRGSRPW